MADEALPLDGVDGAEVAPEEAAPQEPAIVEDTSEPSIADIDADMGWRPQDEWRGDPDKWKPAHEFVRATADVNSKLSRSMKGMQEQIANMARTSAAMTERAVALERQKLLEERQQAFDEGDGDKFTKVDQEIAKLESQPLAQQVTPPETQAFIERNSWFNTDREATAWAQARADELAKQGIGVTRQLGIVEREAKALFPELFPDAKQPPKGVPLTPPGNRGATKAGARNFASLPAEAKKEALYYEKKGIPLEDYARTYYETQEA